MTLCIVSRLEELLNLSTLDLAHEVITLHLQLEEKSKSISLLQRTLNQQRELAVRNARNAARDMKTRLSEQKDEYESAVARHQKFIDQVSDVCIWRLLSQFNLIKVVVRFSRSEVKVAVHVTLSCCNNCAIVLIFFLRIAQVCLMTDTACSPCNSLFLCRELTLTLYNQCFWCTVNM